VNADRRRTGDGSDESGTTTGRAGTWRPVVEFIVLVGLLFGADHVLSPHPERIVVTDQAVRDIVTLQEQMRGQPIGDDELPALVGQFVEDEILVREAFRQGVDRGDPRVREALSSAVWRSLGQDVIVEPPEPGPGELEAFFEANPERYRRPETAAIQVLTFPFGSLSAEQGRVVIGGLQAGESVSTLAGETGRLLDLGAITAQQLSQTYGRAQGIPLFEGDVEVWHGPLVTPQSTDFVRVLSRSRAPQPTFDEVRSLVVQDWIQSRFDESVRESLRSVRRRYRVTLPAEPEP
jgi:hypothetical protein